MSAWLVSDNHINQMVAGAVRLGIIEQSEAGKTGRMLRRANRKSIAARYGRDDEWLREQEPYVFYVPREPISDVSLFKQVHCYDYQTCEYDAYDRSPAKRLVNKMQKALEAKGLDWDSPEVKAAPWGV